jgi:hypothetical protein
MKPSRAEVVALVSNIFSQFDELVLRGFGLEINPRLLLIFK